MTARIAIAVCALAVSGCAQWSAETRGEEYVYQLVSAVDAVQSARGARDPACYTESAQPAAVLIGGHPSPAAAIAWGAARAGVHAAVTGILDAEDADAWVQRIWQFVTIADESYYVHYNWSIGLHFGGARAPAGAPCRQASP